MFEVADDPRFERDGEDLYCEVLVTYPQLVLGADVDVPAVTTNVSLRIPAGTQSGQIFMVRGRGLPRVNASSFNWKTAEGATPQRLVHTLSRSGVSTSW